MEHISDLFGHRRTLLPKGRALNERSELVGYFCNQLGLQPPFVGYRLSHYSVSDLYGLKSAFEDRLNRNGRTSAEKYWWWVTKTQ